MLELQGEGDDQVAAAREFAEKTPGRLRDGVPVRIGSLQGYRAQGRTQTAYGWVKGEITWIAHGGYVYRYSADLELREGEVAADAQTAWLEPPGTGYVGEAYLYLHQQTGDLLSNHQSQPHH